MSRRYKAMLDHFELKVQDISDGFKRALVRHKYPYRDLPDLEDQGLDERTIRFKCFFLRELYDLHFDFLEHIKTNREFTLTHPEHGEIKGGIESVDVQYDKNRQRAAEIDISFVQRAPEDEEATLGDIGGLMGEEFEAGVKAQEEAAAAAVKDALGPESAGVLDKTLDAGKGILEQFSEVTGSVRAFVGQIDSAVNAFESTLADITNPANSLIATIEFAADLPGRVIGSIARTAERYVKLYESARSAPARFVQNFRNSMDRLNDALDLNASDSGTSSGLARAAARKLIKNSLASVGAQMAAMELGNIYSGDETERDKARKLEGAASFDVTGKRLSTGSLPEVLDVREIERSLASVREYIQEAVDLNREMDTLKRQAFLLMRHVNEIKLQRERIRVIWVDNPTHVFILCHTNGLPYGFAQRVMSINQGMDANFASGEVSIYAR